MASKTVSINRAPVLTLWATVVARRLGFDKDEALSLARAVAGLNAYSKGRRLGLFRSLLERHGLPLPAFPGMAWVTDRLPDGTEVAVGVAEAEAGPLAYVFPADKVQFDRTEERRLEGRAAEGAATAVTVHWFTPRR